MSSQRIAAVQTGAHLVFARSCGDVFGQARALSWWRGGPCCLVRRSFGGATLILAAVDGRARREFQACAPHGSSTMAGRGRVLSRLSSSGPDTL